VRSRGVFTLRRCGPLRSGRTGRTGHGALFWRVYVHGLVLLALVAAAFGAVNVLYGRGAWWREPARLAEYAAGRVAELRHDPGRLAEELGRLHDLGVEATVYAEDGRTLLATSVEPPLAPAAGAADAGPVRLRLHGLGYAVPLRGGGQAVFVAAGRAPQPERALLVLGAVLAAIALGSIPLARSIAAPVERLTRAARALGGGDLSVRARVRARGEVGELARAFDEMAERVEALVRSEKELLANVSHELRTPLARIRVALELAAEGDLERARRFLGEIGADLQELDRLVEDVLSTARLDLAARGGAAWPVRREPVDLAAVVSEASDRFRGAWQGRRLEVEAQGPLPTLSGDQALLRRLLFNLLDNAAKYSEPPAPVMLAARAGPGAAVLEVRDEGIGIAPEDLPRLFTPFFRSDRSRARGTGGVGLGLALARRIAEAHGGTIAVESAPGKGTVFRVTLPGG
jgi:signal transduction histidine kinase